VKTAEREQCQAGLPYASLSLAKKQLEQKQSTIRQLEQAQQQAAQKWQIQHVQIQPRRNVVCRFFLPPPELVSAVGKLVELLVGELQHPIEIIGLHIAFKRDAFAFFQRTGHHLVQLFQGIPLSGFAFPRAIPFLHLSGNGLALLCLLTGLPAAFFGVFFFAAFLFQRLFCGLQIIRRLVLDCFLQVLHQFPLRRNLFFLLLPFLCVTGGL